MRAPVPQRWRRLKLAARFLAACAAGGVFALLAWEPAPQKHGDETADGGRPTARKNEVDIATLREGGNAGDDRVPGRFNWLGEASPFKDAAAETPPKPPEPIRLRQRDESPSPSARLVTGGEAGDDSP